LFLFKELHPGDLKAGVEKKINELLEPLRKEMSLPENLKLIEAAYPVEKDKKKK
jgi:tyrosyl-tRNA synthetase